MSAENRNIRIGDRIGQYTILNPLLFQNRNGFLCKAADITGSEYVIKFLEKTDTEFNLDLFKSEYQKLSGLKHPNIAAAKDFGFHDGIFYLVTEFIDGENLYEATYEIQPPESEKLFLQVFEGLDYIHRNGFIHLDIKPENILVRKDGVVKIIDLGVAQNIGKFSGIKVGSHTFMAPEMVFGEYDKVDARTDLYSFAATMHLCLRKGRKPFPVRENAIVNDDIDFDKLSEIVKSERNPEPVSKCRIGIPKHLSCVISRLLAKNPDDRFYENARSVINAINLKHLDFLSEQSSQSFSLYFKPTENAHIGRGDEQKKIKSWIDKIASYNEQLENIRRDFGKIADINSLQPPVILIDGESGIGKTHFLQKMKEHAATLSERINIFKITFPLDELALGNWLNDAETAILKNEKPTIVMIDDFHEFAPIATSDALSRAQKFIEHICSLIEKKRNDFDLHSGIMPILFMVAFDSSKEACATICNRLDLKDKKFEAITLEPFSTFEIESYLESTPLFQGKKPPRNWIETLLRQTQGIPIRLKEQLEDVDSLGMQSELGGKLIFDASLLKAVQKKVIPATTKAKLLKIYESSDDRTRQLLDFLSVWDSGQMADYIDFNDIFNFIPQINLKHRLNQLVQTEVLTCNFDGGYQFQNRDYFPAIIYERMTKDDREYWHGKIYSYLTSQDKNDAMTKWHDCFSSNGISSVKSIMRLSKKLYFRNGDVKRAIKLLEHGMILARNNPKLFACIAALAVDCHQQDGDTLTADSLLQKAIGVLQNIKRGKMWLAKCYTKMTAIALQQRQLENAQLYLDKAKRLIPKQWLTVTNLSLMNYEAKIYHERASVDKDERVQLFDRARKLYESSHLMENTIRAENSLLVRNNSLGHVLVDMGQYDEACIVLGEKLSKHKKEGNIFGTLFSTIALADSYRLNRNLEVAGKIAGQARELALMTNQPTWLMHAHRVLANVYYDEGCFEKAVDESDKRLLCSMLLKGSKESNRDSIAVWLMKGHCYEEMKFLDKAELHFQAVIDNPDSDTSFIMSAHEGLGEVYFAREDWENTFLHMDAALSILNKMPKEAANRYKFSALKIKAKALANSGEGAEAMKLFSELETISKSDPELKSQYEEIKKEYFSDASTISNY